MTDKIDDEITLPIASKILGIGNDKTRNWITRGYIKPSIRTASKRGEKNIFSRADVIRMKAFLVLTDGRGDFCMQRDKASKLIYESNLGDDANGMKTLRINIEVPFWDFIEEMAMCLGDP